MENSLDPDINAKQSIFNKARKDKFLLIFTLPPILRHININLLSQRSDETIKQDAMQYSIYGSPIPDIVVPAHTINYEGQPYKVTSQSRQAYPPININFTVDNRFSNWWIIWKWLDVLNEYKDSGMGDHFGEWIDGPKKNTDVRNAASNIHQQLTKTKNAPIHADFQGNEIHMKNNFLDYQTIMTVFALDEFNNKIVEFNYSNAFPTSLGGIQYNYRDPGEIESSFQFEFNQLEVKLIGEGF